VEQVTNGRRLRLRRKLAREEGILGGISCGAAMVAALRWRASRHTRARPSSWFFRTPVKRYLSGALFEACSRCGEMQALPSSLEKVACAAFSDISFVSAGKKRRFCQLRSREMASRQALV